jgi:tetratricopeptide (TPR) repeat protein
MLVNVGRTAEAIEQLHRADNMLALYVYTPLTLADALVIAGKMDESKPYYDASIDLAPNASFAKYLEMYKAIEIGDINLVLDPSLPLTPELRDALLKGYRAHASTDTEAKTQAIHALLALSQEQQNDAVAKLLADLGATHEAFQLATRIASTQEYPGPSLFFDRRMRPTLDDPDFPAVATQLGLLKYWTTTHARPDVCDEKGAPHFCGMI